MVKKSVLFAFLLSCVFAMPALVFLARLPDPTPLLTENPQTSAIRIFREHQAKEKGRKSDSLMVWRDLNEISPHLQHAVMLAEDDTFFTHEGFDIEQLKRAFKVNWRRKRFAFGASTITQQLARSLYLSPRKNLLRKVKEAVITRRLEGTLTKERILELYLNLVEWGPNVYGAEAASQHFLQKPASELTPEEAISLAVILPSPRRYNPLSDTGYIAGRKIDLYIRMVRAGYIMPESPVEEEPQESEFESEEELPEDVEEPITEEVAPMEVEPELQSTEPEKISTVELPITPPESK